VKLLVALLALLAALLGGLGIILNAPPYMGSAGPPLVGIAFAVAFAVVFRGPLGQALVGQLRDGDGHPGLGQISAQLDELLDEIRALRQDHAELGERVEFTERLLAQHRAGALPGPEPEHRAMGRS
jgi:hypothetical protein